MNASIVYSEEEYKTSLTDHEMVRKYATNGIKTRSSESYGGLQLESRWSGMTWRDFNAPDLDDLSRVVALIDSGETHTDYDRHIISRLAEKGLTIVHLG